MAVPPGAPVLFWLVIVVAFIVFSALAIGMVLLFGYLGYQIFGGEGSDEA